MSTCKRNGTSASSELSSFMDRYLITHEPGNSQTNILSFSEEGQITIAQVEGRIRQECLEYARKMYGSINIKDILEFVKPRVSGPRKRVAMIERVIEWLKEQDVKIWQ